MAPQKKSSFLLTIGLILAFLLPACTSQAVVTPIVAPESVTAPAVVETKRTLTMWHPDSPTTLNPHLTNSIKDLEPARIAYEPLATFNKDGKLVPILAANIPSLENGQVAGDGKSVTWILRDGLRWSDGEPLTADDVVFTYEYVTDKDVKAITAPNYSKIVSVQAVDDLTIKITFKDVTPGWAVPFVGNGGVILPRHVFQAYKGANASEAPANTIPVGTGPYRVKEPGIKPQEVLLLGSQVVKTTKIVFEPNPYFRDPEKITFGQVIWRSGGALTEAARLVFDDGSLDVGHNFDLIDSPTLSDLTNKATKGQLVSAFGSGVERVLINHTDPFTADSNGEKSSVIVPHPLFGDKRVRMALAYAINRDAIAALYGSNGKPTYANLVAPPQYQSSKETYPYDLNKAKALLDEAGIKDANGDGFREKDGSKVTIVYQAAISTIQQQTQNIIKKDLNAIGLDVEIKMIDSSIMFGAGSTNQDASTRFNADIMTFRYRSLSPDPSTYMGNWTCASIPQAANNWIGNNDERWCSKDYDALLEQANKEMNPEKRQQMFIQLNDMLVEDVVLIPMVWRASALGVNLQLQGVDPTPWDSVSWNIQDWKFATP